MVSVRPLSLDENAKATRTQIEIQEWIVSYISELLEVNPAELDTSVPFDHYGLDSAAAVGLTGELEDWLGQELEPILLYDYPTIDALSEYLSESD